jgi:hypothetical protein
MYFGFGFILYSELRSLSTTCRLSQSEIFTLTLQCLLGALYELSILHTLRTLVHCAIMNGFNGIIN